MKDSDEKHKFGGLKWFLVTLTSPETRNKVFNGIVPEKSLDASDFVKLLIEADDVHGNFDNEVWVDDKRIYFSKYLFRVEIIDDIESFKRNNPWVRPL